jgi:hypothetical protein
LGLNIGFDVLFLEGLHLLSSSYREKLSALGYRLHNGESLYRQLKKRYAVLERFGSYEQNCFLRWLAIRDFFGNTPFVHYDADIVFNTTPEEINAELSGLTFILHGCPAYARIEDPAWLESYTTELDRFVADMEAYSTDAWRQRSGFAATAQERNGHLWDRRILSSDQDFMQFLTLSGRLPQADAATVHSRCSSVLFIHPLGIGEETHLPLPLRYERRDGIDYLGDRKVAFWHMTNGFCDYLGYATFLHQLLISSRTPWVQSRTEGPLSYAAYRALVRFTGTYSRGQLIRRYFGEDSRDLGFIFNDKRYWHSGVFV